MNIKTYTYNEVDIKEYNNVSVRFKYGRYIRWVLNLELSDRQIKYRATRFKNEMINRYKRD